MKADWEDAPNHVKGKSSNALQIAMAFIAGCAITATALISYQYSTPREQLPVFITESKYEPGKVKATDAHKKAEETATRKAVEDKKAVALAELLSNQKKEQMILRRASGE